MGIDRRGKSWRARVTLPDRSQRSRSFRTKAEAVRWEVEQKTALNGGQWIDPSSKVTVAEYARQSASMRPHRSSTARHVTSKIEIHIAGTKLGDRRFAAVRPCEVQAWATERSKHLRPLNLRNLVSMVRSIFRDAVLDRLCSENPAARVKLPSYEKPLIVPLTVEQIEALEDAIDNRCRAMVTLQAGAGLRIGELLALRVSDVDFLRKTIRVQYQFAGTDSKERTAPKTPRSKRVVPVPQFVIDAIAEHLRKYSPGDDGTLFVTEAGNAWRHDFYGSKKFKAAVRAAGLPESTTTHDLRHAYASILLAAGEPVTTVANRLGHANPGVTLSTYAHLIADQDERTRKALEGAWGRSSVQQLSKQDHASP
jgi:integrase